MYLSQIKTFDSNSLPDLDVVALGALEFFEKADLPDFDFSQFSRPLIVGSGNAAVVGKLLFDSVDAVFADESSYISEIERVPTIDAVVLISASGSKHAISIATDLIARQKKVVLLTNNFEAPAKAIVGTENTIVFPKIREPYTYNTSTYMGMLLSKTGEDPTAISEYIQNFVVPRIPKNLMSYGAFYLIVPEVFTEVREMFQTKFNELFGPKLVARIFTLEQTKHAKTVIPRSDEVFISFGTENTLFGSVENRVHIPLPEDADYAAMMAIGYVCIGHIQKQFPPFYKERIEAYCEETSNAFGSTIRSIVE